jgi:hypothetical protein
MTARKLQHRFKVHVTCHSKFFAGMAKCMKDRGLSVSASACSPDKRSHSALACKNCVGKELTVGIYQVHCSLISLFGFSG